MTHKTKDRLLDVSYGSLSYVLIVLLVVFAIGCTERNPVDNSIDSSHGHGTYETFNLYAGSRAWKVRLLNNKNSADWYCREQGYQYATEYSGRYLILGSERDAKTWLNEVTCWKP